MFPGQSGEVGAGAVAYWAHPISGRRVGRLITDRVDLEELQSSCSAILSSLRSTRSSSNFVGLGRHDGGHRFRWSPCAGRRDVRAEPLLPPSNGHDPQSEFQRAAVELFGELGDNDDAVG